MLKNADSECKRLKARLDRLVTNSNKLYTQLNEGMSKEYEVLEGLGQMFKVSLKDKEPPLVVNFIFANKED
jgi:hypothetical protein